MIKFLLIDSEDFCNISGCYLDHRNAKINAGVSALPMRVDTPRPKGTRGFLVQRVHLPQFSYPNYARDSFLLLAQLCPQGFSFHSITEVCFGMPYRTVSTLKLWFAGIA
jgi:hypothetical protein